MKCWKCDKEMGREDGGVTIKGIEVTVIMSVESISKEEEVGVNLPITTGTRVNIPFTQETIDYNNRQLGKYSDGKGGCNVGICYECYIDGLFHIK